MRGVFLHGVLALTGLLLAYSVWTTGDAPERADSSIQLIECSAAQVSRLKLRTKEREVELRRRDQQGHAVYWFRFARTPTEGEPTVQEFVGSKAAGEYVDSIAPLTAIRSLGALDNAQLEAVGLKTPEATFEYECGARTQTFSLGGTTYGASDRYARASSGGPVYLLAADTVRKLETAESQLMQRELTAFEMSDVEALTLEAGGQRKRLLQRERQNERRASWVDAAEPERVNELYGNWVQNRLLRLRVQKYLAPGSDPAAEVGGAAIAPVFTVEFTGADGGERLGRIELVRSATVPERYFARTDATRAWVEVARALATQAEDDGRAVLGLDAIEHASEEPVPVNR